MLFGYLAGITSLELGTGIIVLPQRQTALVAEQAAEVDLLTNGRFRLGVGVGVEPRRVRRPRPGVHLAWQRSGEQVELMRRLWTEQTVRGTVDDERIVGARLSPLPRIHRVTLS